MKAVCVQVVAHDQHIEELWITVCRYICINISKTKPKMLAMFAISQHSCEIKTFSTNCGASVFMSVSVQLNEATLPCVCACMRRDHIQTCAPIWSFDTLSLSLAYLNASLCCDGVFFLFYWWDRHSIEISIFHGFSTNSIQRSSLFSSSFSQHNEYRDVRFYLDSFRFTFFIQCNECLSVSIIVVYVLVTGIHFSRCGFQLSFNCVIEGRNGFNHSFEHLFEKYSISSI